MKNEKYRKKGILNEILNNLFLKKSTKSTNNIILAFLREKYIQDKSKI